MILYVVVVVIVGCEMMTIIPPDRPRMKTRISIIIIRKRACDSIDLIDDSFIHSFNSNFCQFKSKAPPT